MNEESKHIFFTFLKDIVDRLESGEYEPMEITQELGSKRVNIDDIVYSHDRTGIDKVTIQYRDTNAHNNPR